MHIMQLIPATMHDLMQYIHTHSILHDVDEKEEGIAADDVWYRERKLITKRNLECGIQRRVKFGHAHPGQ